MSHSTPLNRLSNMAGKNGLLDLHIPTITEDAKDVIGNKITMLNDHYLI